MIDPARYPSLGAILEDAFHQYTSDVACIEVDRERENHRLSYRDVRRTSEQVAGWLTTQGIGTGSRVGIVMTNQTAWLVAAAAILRIGAIIVPLDARLTAPEQRALLQHAQVSGLFVDAHLWRHLDLAVPATVVTGARHGQDLGEAVAYEQVAAHTGRAPLAAVGRDDIAAIVYSSGTGGDPKGCLLSHGTYLAQYGALMQTFSWRRGDRYFSILPTNHAIDFMCGFIASFCTGTTVIHQRTLRPEFLLKTMRRYRVTQMAVVPLILKALERAIRERLDEQPDDRRRIFDALTTLNAALTAKAPNHGLSRWLIKPIHDAFGGQLRILYCGGAYTERSLAQFFADLGLPVAIGYGLTEACTVATVNDLKPFRADTVGRPVPGMEVRIANPGPDGVGDVQLRGPMVFSGYLDDPAQTAAAFDGDWLRTGDLGWIDAAHHLHLVGRRKNMIVTPGGKNVYPEDIEAAFAEVDAEDLAVFAADYVWPRQDLMGERLIAVVRTDDRARALTALSTSNRRLPDFKRIHGVLWWDDAFPRTASMKVQRIALADRLRTTHTPGSVEVLP